MKHQTGNQPKHQTKNINSLTWNRGRETIGAIWLKMLNHPTWNYLKHSTSDIRPIIIELLVQLWRWCLRSTPKSIGKKLFGLMLNPTTLINFQCRYLWSLDPEVISSINITNRHKVIYPSHVPRINIDFHYNQIILAVLHLQMSRW